MITVYIDAVDRSAWVKSGMERRTVKVSHTLGSESTATIPVGDADDALTGYRPGDDEPVVIEHDGGSPPVRLFNGPISEIEEAAYDREADEGVLSIVTARGMRAITEQIQDVVETIPAGTTRKAALETLQANYLAEHGITLDPAMSTGAVLPLLEFDGVTPQVFLNQIQDITGEVWRLTPDDVLEMFAIGDKLAAISLAATNAGSVSLKKSRSRYCNRVRLKAGTASLVVKDDVFTGDGATDAWVSTYTPVPNPETGFIICRGVVHEDDGVTPQDLTLSGPGGGGAYEFDTTTNTLTRVAGNLPSGWVITFTYTVQFPITVEVEDYDEIVAHGVWSKTFTDTTIFDLAAATEKAEGLLETGLTFPRIVTLMTTEGFELPGTTITLTFPKRLVSGDWLITQVELADFEGDDIEYTYTCQSGARLQRTSEDTLKERIGNGGTVTVTPSPSVAIALAGGVEFNDAGAIQRSALTGDVTASVGSNATTIANGAVTLAKMANMATDSAIGRISSGAGVPEVIASRFIRTGTGHPHGVVSAPVGTFWLDTNTGYMFRKCGGGTTAYGWYYIPPAGPGMDGGAPIWHGWQVGAATSLSNPGMFGLDTANTVVAGASGWTYVTGLGRLFFIRTTAVSGNSAYILLDNIGSAQWWDDDFDLVFTIRTSSDISSLRLWVGIADNSPIDLDTYNNAAPTAMLFRYATTVPDGGWVGFTQTAAPASSVTATVANIAVDTTYRMRLRFVRSGTPTLYVSVNDGTEVAKTTDIPATGITPPPVLGITTKTGGTREVYYRSCHLLIGAQS